MTVHLICINMVVLHTSLVVSGDERKHWNDPSNLGPRRLYRSMNFVMHNSPNLYTEACVSRAKDAGFP